MHFKAFGPFRLPTGVKGVIDSAASGKAGFWDKVEEEVPGLADACGVYVFALRTGGGTRPWYVGKAERQAFRKECLQSGKLVNYTSVSVAKKGTPLLYLIAHMTPKGAFRRPTTRKRPAIRSLEELLIGVALSRNPNLLNIQKTKMYKELSIEGVMNSNKKGSSKAARGLKKVLGFE